MYSAKCLSPVQSSRNGKNPNSILDFMRYTQVDKTVFPPEGVILIQTAWDGVRQSE